MKKLLFILLILVMFTATGFAAVNVSVWTGSGTNEGIKDEVGASLVHTPEADFIQIIKASSGIQSIGSTPPNYLGSGESLITTTEVGHEFLGTIEGHFFKEISADTADIIYVRAFNSNSIVDATYYGNSETYTVTGDLWQTWNINGTPEPAFQTDIPLDFQPPGPPVSFEATPEPNADIYLTWVNTNEPDLAGVEIRYRTDGSYPSSETDGLQARIGAAVSGAADADTHTGLTHGITYYYSAFSYDTANNYSITYATASATAADIIPPSVESHSIIGSDPWLDVRIIFSEEMSKESTELAFSIFPVVSPTFSWNMNGNEMTCDLGLLQYNTTYYCTEEITATDLVGNSLVATYEFSFSVGPPPPDLIPPIISLFRVDGREIIDGDIISSTPVISALISDEGDPTGIASIEFFADIIPLYYGLPGDSFDTLTGTFEYTISSSQELAKGTYTIILKAYDLSMNSTEEVRLNILVFDEIGIVGPIRNYPNPFSPLRTDAGTTIAYDLKSDFTVILRIYDIAANVIWSRKFPAGMEGGHVGYNEVYWNGKTDFNEIPSNGIYVIQLIGGGRVLGTATMTVLD